MSGLCGCDGVEVCRKCAKAYNNSVKTFAQEQQESENIENAIKESLEEAEELKKHNALIEEFLIKPIPNDPNRCCAYCPDPNCGAKKVIETDNNNPFLNDLKDFLKFLKKNSDYNDMITVGINSLLEKYNNTESQIIREIFERKTVTILINTVETMINKIEKNETQNIEGIYFDGDCLKFDYSSNDIPNKVQEFLKFLWDNNLIFQKDIMNIVEIDGSEHCCVILAILFGYCIRGKTPKMMEERGNDNDNAILNAIFNLNDTGYKAELRKIIEFPKNENFNADMLDIENLLNINKDMFDNEKLNLFNAYACCENAHFNAVLPEEFVKLDDVQLLILYKIANMRIAGRQKNAQFHNKDLKILQEWDKKVNFE